MNFVDIIIVFLLISSLVRGLEVGSIRQILSTIGFFTGLFAGAWLEPKLVRLAHTPLSRSLLAIGITLGSALLVMSIAEYIGIKLKYKLAKGRLDRVDGVFGSVVGAVTLILTVWLAGAVLLKLPFPALQEDIRGSAIISTLERKLPGAPPLIDDLGHLINPNGFPQVFTGNEPTPAPVKLPDLSNLQPAIAKDAASVVKIEGRGCGGIIEGSGFVAAQGLVATNAHVVAGVEQPFVIDRIGRHPVEAIWFDPDLDFAVLKVDGIQDAPLALGINNAKRGTAGAALGYPGGGDFVAQPAVVLDSFIAEGRNIYNQGTTDRNVYEVQTHVVPGNSGGPLVASDGTVIGVIFAQSTTYDNVGYALTMSAVKNELKRAQVQMQPVSTGSCAQE